MKDLSGARRVAVMGGTFDPIHNGHLVAAEMVRDRFSIDRVVFIPSGNPPHKDSDAVTQCEDRYLMVAMAISSNPFFDVSRMEMDRPGASYTVDTLREMADMCEKKAKLHFIAGADALGEIRTWREPDEILKLCTLVAVTRAGYDQARLAQEVKALREDFGAKVSLLQIPEIAISSTEIRERVQRRLPVRYMVPDLVESYISKQGLYRIKWDGLEHAEEAVRAALSDKRWRHTLGVIQEACILSKRFNADQKKAYVAALLHDVAKEIPNDEKLRLCKLYGIRVDEIMAENPDLTHSYLSAELAKRDFNIKDKDILNAIRYHNTGRRDMSALEKTLIVADCAEAYRQDYPMLPAIRAAARNDLDEATKLCLESKIAFTEKKGKEVHPLSFEALGDLTRVAAK
jgi:nicotinate-nucleotide adenylyltransferase